MHTEELVLLVNKRHQRRKKHQLVFETGALGVGAITSLILFFGLLLAVWNYINLTSDLPSLEALPVLLDPPNGLLLQPTQLLDRSGQHVIYTLENPGIQRRFLPFKPGDSNSISPQMVAVAVALLEPSFWQSPGISLINFSNPIPSTLAERLASDMLLLKEPMQTRRALRMRILAAQITAHFGRTRVLEWYLNSAYFGHLAYGVESAAQLYFGKSASQVDLAESALLMAALEAPALNPMDASTAALERQKDILKRLYIGGVISNQDYEILMKQPLALRSMPPQSQSYARAFSLLVIDQLAEAYGRATVERGGLKITTTLDYDLQQQLTCAILNQLARLESAPEVETLANGTACDAKRLLPTLPPLDRPYPNGLAGSAILMDPQSGEVLAFLGDTTLAIENSSLSSHPPGSLLTPFVALAGFARGLAPASMVWDISDPALDWQNPDGIFHGPKRLRMALANDYLVPLTQLLIQIGPTNVWRFNEPLGLQRLIFTPQPNSILYGEGSLTLLELAQAYAVIADQGVQSGQRLSADAALRPATVIGVTDLTGRNMLPQHTLQSRSVLSQPLAYLVHQVLSDESARWQSLGYPNPLEIGRPAGAKIGQVSDSRQVWTAGYTRQHLVIVWLGLPDDAPDYFKLSPKMASGIWHAIMQYASQNLPIATWQTPPGISEVTVCDPSGQLPTRDCPNTVSEVFISGNEPSVYDTLFRVFQINRETGLLATVFTPPELIDERSYMVFPQQAQAWAAQAGIQMPPTGYDSIQAPLPIIGAQITFPVQFSFVTGKVAIRGSASGDDFVSYHLQYGQGLNPRTWSNIGNESTGSVPDGLLAEWDTSGLEGLYAVRLVVVRQDQRIDTATLQVTVDNTAPRVRVLYPATETEFNYPGERQITLQVEVDEKVGIRRLEWFIDEIKIGETLQSPHLLSYQADLGEHVLVVKATDLAGNVGGSTPIIFSLR
jgi:membrane peptidoglycan carboxypeptidase